ncbi:MAG TPA: hypothetical protein VED46_00915 [Alphaproteobacteria bacterium]|nr:hypothetical protein [Alphaproteobacteria bacterium]
MLPLLLLSGSVLLVVLASFFLAGMILRQGVTPDYPWLLATGEWILDYHRLPATDLFSWTAAERGWIVYQWAFEIVLASIHRLAGHETVATLIAWSALAIYLIVPLHTAPRRTPALLIAAIGAAVLAVVSVNLSLRPMIATSAGLLVQHLLIYRMRAGRTSLLGGVLWIFPLYAAWANLHTGFALGIGSLLLILAGDWTELRRDVEPGSKHWSTPLHPSQVGALLLAATLGTLITPYGPQLHTYLALLSTEAALNARIDELGSPDFGMFQFQLLLGLVLLLVAAMTRQSGALRPADLLQLAALILATFFAARFVVWSALYLVLLLPTVVARAWPALSRHCMASSRRPLILILTLAAISAPPLLASRGFADPVGHLCARLTPAIEAYAAQRLPQDRLLTDPISGSCMIAAAPGIPVFIDTRFDFYGGAFSTATLDALALKSGWRTLIEGYRIDVAVLDRRRPLAEALTIDSQFTILFRDSEAVVVRRLH